MWFVLMHRGSSADQTAIPKATLLKDTEIHPRQISLDFRTKDVGTQSEID